MKFFEVIAGITAFSAPFALAAPAGSGDLEERRASAPFGVAARSYDASGLLNTRSLDPRRENDGRQSGSARGAGDTGVQDLRGNQQAGNGNGDNENNRDNGNGKKGNGKNNGKGNNKNNKDDEDKNLDQGVIRDQTTGELLPTNGGQQDVAKKLGNGNGNDENARDNGNNKNSQDNGNGKKGNGKNNGKGNNKNNKDDEDKNLDQGVIRDQTTGELLPTNGGQQDVAKKLGNGNDENARDNGNNKNSQDNGNGNGNGENNQNDNDNTLNQGETQQGSQQAEKDNNKNKNKKDAKNKNLK